MLELKNVRRFVAGACLDHPGRPDEHMNLPPWDQGSFHAFVERTTNVVWKYLHGSQTLDGSCSDFECVLSIEAAQVFGKPATCKKE